EPALLHAPLWALAAREQGADRRGAAALRARGPAARPRPLVLGGHAPRARPRPRDSPPAGDPLPRRADARPRPRPAPTDLGVPAEALHRARDDALPDDALPGGGRSVRPRRDRRSRAYRRPRRARGPETE